MNAVPPPLPPDLVDELLSADLDGAFDDAAADLGLDADEARARLSATPGADERRAAIAAARDALAVPPLADDARSRLVAGALAAAAVTEQPDGAAVVPIRRPGADRRTRLTLRLLGAAAAIAVVAGVVAAIATSGGDSESSNDAATGDAATELSDDGGGGGDDAGALASYDFGDVTDPDSLNAAVTDALGTDAARDVAAEDDAASDSGATTTAGSDDGAAPSTAEGAPDGDGAESGALVPASCAAAMADQFAPDGTLVLDGVGLYDGRAVSVTVFETGADVQAFVADPDAGCALLTTQLLRPEG